jgi:hypothetical protein
MGKNQYPHAGMGFLASRIRVSGYGYEIILSDGFLPVAISTHCTTVEGGTTRPGNPHQAIEDWMVHHRRSSKKGHQVASEVEARSSEQPPICCCWSIEELLKR